MAEAQIGKDLNMKPFFGTKIRMNWRILDLAKFKTASVRNSSRRENMNRIKTFGLLVVLAALMLVPEALAVTATFGSDSVSTTNVITPGENNAVSGKDVISSGTSMASTFSGSGPLNEYHQWYNWDFSKSAATYAYLDTVDGGSWTYTWSGSSTKSGATASETVRGKDVENMLLGGFAYDDNSGKYAAVQLMGDYAKSIDYRNSMSVTSKKFGASQNFKAKEAYLQTGTWAEKGNIGGESRSEEDILNMMPGPTPNPEWYDYLSGQYMGIYAGDINSYTSSASIASSSVSSKQSANIASADDVNLNGGALEGEVSPQIWVPWLTRSWWSDVESQEGAGTVAVEPNGAANENSWADGAVAQVRTVATNGKNMIYSSESEGSKNRVTAEQSVSIPKADNIYKGAFAFGIGDNDKVKVSDDFQLYSAEEGALALKYPYPPNTYMPFDASKIPDISSSMTGSDSASASNAGASVTQKMSAKGINIQRWIGADFGSEDADYKPSGYDGEEYTDLRGVYAETDMFMPVHNHYYDDQGYPYCIWTPRIPATANRLSGQSTASVNEKTATLKGSWSTYLAKDLTDYDAWGDYWWDEYNYYYYTGPISFFRLNDAYNEKDEYASVYADKISTDGPKQFSFKESSTATSSKVTAA